MLCGRTMSFTIQLISDTHARQMLHRPGTHLALTDNWDYTLTITSDILVLKLISVLVFIFSFFYSR